MLLNNANTAGSYKDLSMQSCNHSQIIYNPLKLNAYKTHFKIKLWFKSWNYAKGELKNNIMKKANPLTLDWKWVFLSSSLTLVPNIITSTNWIATSAHFN